MTGPSLGAPLTFAAWLRYDAVERLLPAEGGRLLEIGAGLGSVGVLLARRYRYVGLEPDPTSYAVARRRLGTSGEMVNASAEGYPAGGAFDVVCAFEVLEHCEDDRASLAAWLGHLRPGGHALVSVPFGRDRFGAWDEKAGHYRRYDRQDLVKIFEGVGLESVETIVYGFPLGSASELVRSRLAGREQKGRPSESIQERTLASARNYQPPSWASVATWALASPFRYVQRPFAHTTRGSGIVARGRLPLASG